MTRLTCRIFAVIVLLFGAAEAYAVGATSEWGTITQLNIRADGTEVMVRFSQPIVNPGTCEGVEFYIRELDDTPASSRFLSALLAANAAKQEVMFWIEDCTSKRWWGKTRPQLYDIYIR